MAEIFLRLGCSLVGWLMLFAHGLLLAVIPAADCSPELWRTTLGFALLAAIGALLLPAALAWRASMRWCALPALPLWAVGAWVATSLLGPATLDGASLCDAWAGAAKPEPAAGWERAWAPLQLVAIAGGVIQAGRFWRRA